MVKNPTANAGDLRDESSIPGSRISPGVVLATHSTILAWKIPWQRSLEGYSPCGPKERHDSAAEDSTTQPMQET